MFIIQFLIELAVNMLGALIILFVPTVIILIIIEFYRCFCFKVFGWKTYTKKELEERNFLPKPKVIQPEFEMAIDNLERINRKLTRLNRELNKRK